MLIGYCSEYFLPSAAGLGDCDLAPVAALQSRPREHQMMSRVWSPPPHPRKFVTRDLTAWA